MSNNFADEINGLYTDEFKEFVEEAFNLAPEWQYNDDDIHFTKTVFHYAKSIVGALDLEDESHDMVLSAALLHALCRYNMLGGERLEDEMHMFHLRGYLAKFMPIIGVEQYHSMMTLIESQMGFKSPIPQVMPRIDDPVHMWVLPLAIHISKEEYDAEA